ncbi:cell wall / vacuolar inhibitor of fructosidase 2 [Brachypodium distachyon]|uniref:Pectinesterase inhibitor domain-containing protein n=1 Tax=Brachypodium distachyon TaxID=15368 RepID=I1GLB8_BRADI|nr:cell wall / vacuolar inhibitor of fructosidase 2 [Brachypodium distachyon]KQK12341.1 hypothetical protein BRADI_1g03070v3 [Brachypodium distachyon]|eukprot:XP_003559213.2 cell wall / vacuolar inhibitor of fructosidase 2 [Brachypodium distachyon]
MATRRTTSGTFFFFLLPLILAAAAAATIVKEAATVDINAICSKTSHPDFCTTTLSAIPETKTADARGLAEIAIRATSRVGATAGAYARKELDIVKDNALWQCLDECAEDIEDAVAHLDDSEGQIGDAKYDLVAKYLDAAEKDLWSCDESCRDTPASSVKTTVLAKNTDFEKMMAVTNELIKMTGKAAAAAAADGPSSEPASAPEPAAAAVP